jgi:hypothetical protein
MRPRFLAILGLLAVPAPAQPLPGDWILTAGAAVGGGLYAVSPGGSVLTPVATVPLLGTGATRA